LQENGNNPPGVDFSKLMVISQQQKVHPDSNVGLRHVKILPENIFLPHVLQDAYSMIPNSINKR
jgi:hypothetical protein